MTNISILQEKFNTSTYEYKFIVNENLVEVLKFVKNDENFNFDMLTSIVANDLQDKIELIYQLYSTKSNEVFNIYYYANDFAPSVIGVYSSAYFDECEIFDLFGLRFNGNEELKRLYMPENWKGYPLLKSYKNDDERLAWND